MLVSSVIDLAPASVLACVHHRIDNGRTWAQKPEELRALQSAVAMGGRAKVPATVGENNDQVNAKWMDESAENVDKSDAGQHL